MNQTSAYKHAHTFGLALFFGIHLLCIILVCICSPSPFRLNAILIFAAVGMSSPYMGISSVTVAVLISQPGHHIYIDGEQDFSVYVVGATVAERVIMWEWACWGLVC